MSWKGSVMILKAHAKPAVKLSCFHSCKTRNTKPIPLNFSMKNLLEAEACLICGSFDSEEDLWICDECHDGFHYYCLYPKDIDVRKSIRMEEDLPWHCPRCCICLKCGGKTNEGSLITCLDCKKTYHIRCVGEKNCGLYWKCEECFKCEICESKTMFNKNDEPIRYELCENYSKCYQCSVLEAFFHFCRYCKKVINLDNILFYSKNIIKKTQII